MNLKYHIYLCAGSCGIGHRAFVDTVFGDTKEELKISALEIGATCRQQQDKPSCMATKMIANQQKRNDSTGNTVSEATSLVNQFFRSIHFK